MTQLNQMIGSVCLANATLILPKTAMRGSVTVSDGVIADISEGDAVPPGAVDCQGDHVLPGLVELHTDNLERHIEPRPQVDWPHLPALVAHDAELASVGVTTVFDALRVGSIHDGRAKYGAYARKLADELLAAQTAGCFKISHRLHLRAEICSDTLLEELEQFGPDDRIGIVSLMDHTPGQRQFRDMVQFKAYVTKKRGMSEDEFAAHVVNLDRMQKAYGAQHEVGAVAAARRYGAALASHDDTTAAQVATSQAHGVSFAEFPTTQEAAEACRAAGIAVMMGAPNLIRGASHSGNVAALDLAQAGLLDILSSDYVPAALLVSAYKLATIWDDLPRAVACVTAAPARATGMADRGALEKGLRGDLVRVRPYGDTPLVQEVYVQGRRVA